MRTLSPAAILLAVLACSDTQEPAADYSGTWNTAPQITYSCGFGLVTINFAQVVVAHTGSAIAFTPEGTEPGTMTGAIDGQGEFTAQRVIPGSVTQTYTLEGVFVGDDSLEAVFTAQYTATNGTDCTNQTDPIGGHRVAVAVP